MLKLVAKLEKAVTDQLRVCGTAQPGDREVAYHLGLLQGKYAGLALGLRIVLDFISEDEDIKDNL